MESGFLLQHVKQCSGLGVCGLGFRVQGVGFYGLRFWLIWFGLVFEFRVYSSGLKV